MVAFHHHKLWFRGGHPPRKYIINGIIEDGHFLIYVLSMKTPFPVEFTNYLLNQITIPFFIMPNFTFIGGWVVNFEVKSCIDYLMIAI